MIIKKVNILQNYIEIIEEKKSLFGIKNYEGNLEEIYNKILSNMNQNLLKVIETVIDK